MEELEEEEDSMPIYVVDEQMLLLPPETETEDEGREYFESVLHNLEKGDSVVSQTHTCQY